MNMAFIRLKKEDVGNKNEAITLALRLEIVSCVGVWEKGGGKEKRRRPMGKGGGWRDVLLISRSAIVESC